MYNSAKSVKYSDMKNNYCNSITNTPIQFPTFMKLKHRRMQEGEKFANKYLKKNFCYSNSLNVKTREKQIDDGCWLLNNIFAFFLFIKFVAFGMKDIVDSKIEL